MNLAYLYLAHVVQWPAATIVGFAAVVMTLSKTVLYWAQEYYCGFCAIGHNNAWIWSHFGSYRTGTSDMPLPRLLKRVFYTGLSLIISSRFWIVVPAIIVVQLGKDLIESLNFASEKAAKVASGKTQ